MLRRRRRPTKEIPQASLPDIAFLLLIFFLVSTQFAIEEGLLLQLPSAEGGAKKMATRNTMTIMAFPDGHIEIDGRPVTIEMVKPAVEQAMIDNPKLVIVIETMREATYGIMIDILDELKLAQASRISLRAGQ